MVKEFEDIAFKMKPNEISKPVKTQFGYHIIKLIEHKDGSQRPFDEVKESIEKLLKNKKQRQAKQDLLKALKTEAKVEACTPVENTVKVVPLASIKLDKSSYAVKSGCVEIVYDGAEIGRAHV